MVSSQPSRRFSKFVSASLASGTGFAGGLGRIYGLMLLLLVMVFFMLVFRGKAPRAIERVFTSPVARDQAALEARHARFVDLAGGAYLDPKDGETFAETAGYRRLIGGLIDHVRPGDVVEDPPLFDRELAMQAPDLQRGEIVKVVGYVAKHWAQKLDQPIFQIADVWRAVVADADGEDGVVVDFVAQPPSIVEQRDKVEFVATFYRLVSYQTTSGASIEIPYLLAREMKKLPDEQRSPVGLGDPASIVLLVALAAMVVWGVMRVVKSKGQRPTVRWRAPHPALPSR
jgi:hypothetical protein